MINEFIEYLKIQRNLSFNTLKQYESILTYYEAYKDKYLDPEDYIAFLSKYLSPRSINTHISCIRTYYRFLVKKGMEQRNIFETVDLLRTPSELPQPLSALQVNRIFKKAQGEYRIGFLTMLYTGLRLSECLSLTTKNFEKDKIRIIGKGSKERITYFINKEAEQEVKKYTRGKRGKIFKFSISSFQKMAQKLGFHAHQLRHTFATMCLEKGMDINFISRLLGHAKLSTTMIYAKITDKKLREEVEKIKNEI